MPVALITGGTGGMGQAIAQLLQAHDFQLILSSRNPDSLVAATSNPPFMPLKMDVTDAAQVEQGFRKIVDEYGRLDLLVNAAGVTQFSPLLRMQVEDWDAQFAVHARGSFLCSQQALKLMRKQKSGTIVHISSLAAKLSKAGFAAYGAAKAALVNLNLNLNAEAGRYGVRSTVLCPTYVDTPMLADANLDALQMIPPSVIAETILFLWHLPDYVLIPELVIDTVASSA